MRNTFGSSRLVRLLSAWTPLQADAGGMDVAERTGAWVNAFDAIGLQSAQQALHAIRTAAPPEPLRARGARLPPEEDLQQVRATLAGAIEAAVAADAPYSVYRQRHLELQRQMEQAIGPLRERVRQALGRSSPRLRKLAGLDAVYEHVLAPREQALLRQVAVVLQRRFEQLCQAQGDAGTDAFLRDWQQALLAELDLRLEPVSGLIAATSKERMEQA